MKKAALVLTATVAGLVGVLSFHTRPAKISLGTTSGSTTPPTTPPTTAPNTTPVTSGGSGTTPTTVAPPTTAPVNATRSATGPVVNFSYGTISVKATVTGSKLTSVTIASLDDGGNPQSQSIDQQSIPMLKSQALAAGNANIQGVSGASYTSQGFAQSLQAALAKLGL